MSKEILSLIMGLLGLALVVYGSFCLIRVAKRLRNRQYAKYITITPEDVDLIREALAVSRINHNILYENNLFDFEKYTVDQSIALQKQLTTIANQSSAIIEVSK